MSERLSTREVVDVTTANTYGTWRFQRGWRPLHIVDAEGCYFVDSQGKRYLDFSSQLMCVSLGHRNAAVIRAIQEQARRLPYVAPGFTTDIRAELSRLLLEVLPAGLDKFFDEVMTGWGRTGRWFAVDHWGVNPDILVTAKGITTAYSPLGLCATSRKIADFFEDHFFSHGHTYEAHPLTLAPAVAAIQEYRRLNLIERAKELGAYLGEKLQALQERHGSVGDVRGLGLFWAVELVRSRRTKEPFNTRRDKVSGKPLVVDAVAADMMKRGVSIQGWLSHFVIAPPLIITPAEIDEGVSALDTALARADELVEE